jgi:hypothetical protein
MNIPLGLLEEILGQFGVKIGEKEVKLFSDAYSTKKD